MGVTRELAPALIRQFLHSYGREQRLKQLCHIPLFKGIVYLLFFPAFVYPKCKYIVV